MVGLSEGAKFTEGLCAGATAIIGVSIFGDCSAPAKSDTSFSNLFAYATSLHKYDPFTYDNQDGNVNYKQEKYQYILRFFLILAGIVIIPETLIFLSKIL